MFDDSPELVAVVVIVCLFCIIILCVLTAPFITQNIPCKVYEGTKIIYSGKAFRIQTKSVGASSQIQINDGFMALFPTKYYVGNEYKIVCK